MDYLASFDISAAGMGIEKLRLDVTAINLANAQTTRAADGTLYKPLRVVAEARPGAFDALLGVSTRPADVARVEVREIVAEPRLVYDPNHPDADEKGFVAYPNVNTVSEMVNLITATRAYEANVRAMNAAKTMAMKALEIGGGS